MQGFDFEFRGEDLQYHQNEYCKMEIKDGILFCVFAPFLNITLEVATAIVEDRVEFCNGKTYPTLTNISNLKYIDRPAREYMASDFGIKGINAAAYVASTQNEMFLWEMFLKINRPAIESKIFGNTHEALMWLKKMK